MLFDEVYIEIDLFGSNNKKQCDIDKSLIIANVITGFLLRFT